MQVIDGLYNGYGDKLSEYEFSEAASNLFPKHYISDIATKIIGEFFDNKTLGRCCQTSKRWNKVINHFVALKKIELYEKISHPGDWNRWQTEFTICPEEMKEAFRSLPLNIDSDKYAVAYKPENLTLSKIIPFLKEKNILCNISENIIRAYGEGHEDGAWLMETRSLVNKGFRKTPADLLGMVILMGAEKIKFDKKLFAAGFRYTRVNTDFDTDSSLTIGWDKPSRIACKIEDNLFNMNIPAHRFQVIVEKNRKFPIKGRFLSLY